MSDAYGSHMPVLEWLISHFGIKKVFEYGCGVNSTALFRGACEDVTSVEMQDESWYEKILSTKWGQPDRWTNFELVLSLGKDVKEIARNMDAHYDLIFVDGHGYSRFDQVRSGFQRTDLIVAHDTEARIYRWDRIVLPEGWYWIDIEETQPWTAVITNNQDILSKTVMKFASTPYDRETFKDKAYTNNHMEDV